VSRVAALALSLSTIVLVSVRAPSVQAGERQDISLRTDPLNAVNTVRSSDCGQYQRAAPVRANPKLREAAERIAAGETLDSALKNAGYRADRSALLRLTGSVSDQEIVQSLRAKLCATVSDAGLAEAGSARRGDELWIVMANAFSPPRSKDRNAVAQEVLNRVNQARAIGHRCGSRYFAPAPPLRLDASLTVAAQTHAANMARLGVLEHRGRDGSTPAQRVRAAGYQDLGAVAENIAGGAMNAREAMDGWLTSAGHCANLMNPTYTQMGVAYSLNESSPLGIYWAQDFAAPQTR
jgi:uncharacterized protein YkwD